MAIEGTRRWMGMAAVLAVGLVGCDLGTKELAVRGLRGEPPFPVAGDLLQLRYTENTDVGFSLLRWLDEPTRLVLLLVLVPLVVLTLVALWWRRRRKASALEHLAYASLLAGALGNFLDRALRGHVVDFIALPHYPVFNVADIAVAVGVGLMLLATRRSARAAPVPPD